MRVNGWIWVEVWCGKAKQRPERKLEGQFWTWGWSIPTSRGRKGEIGRALQSLRLDERMRGDELIYSPA